MVPITAFSASVYSVLEYLRTVMAENNKPGVLSGLLAVHFLLGRDSKSNVDWQVSIPLDAWILENRSDLDQAPLLATLGCLLVENSVNLNNLSALSLFVDGIERLKQRQNIFTAQNSWILNSEIVLGISVGVFNADVNRENREWLKGILKNGIGHNELPYFLRLIYLYCLFLSGQYSG